MYRTAGLIRSVARKRRCSNVSRHPPFDLASATAATARRSYSGGGFGELCRPVISDGCTSSARASWRSAPQAVPMENSGSVAEITLEKLNKVYSDGTHAVRDLDLEINDGRFVVLVGPSGCGKTSALRMIAGLEPISEGIVRIGGKIVNDLPPKNRDVAMVFQNYALYPHMTAYKNMAFGLKLRKLDRKEIDRRVRDAARVLGLPGVLRKRA